MSGNASARGKPPKTYTFAQVEAALFALHEVSVQTATTFRARLRNFQRIGVVPSSPGKGRRIEYTIQDAIRWASCFQLSELGLPPSICREIVSFATDAFVIPYFLHVKDAETPLLFVISGDFLSWQIEGLKIATATGRPFLVGTLRPSQIGDQWRDTPRFLLLELSGMKQRLGELLAHEWIDDAAHVDDPFWLGTIRVSLNEPLTAEQEEAMHKALHEKVFGLKEALQSPKKD